MNKFLTFLTFLFCCCMFTATAMASSDSESGNGVVLSPVSDNNNTTDHPSKPAYRPIYGVMTADMDGFYYDSNIKFTDGGGKVKNYSKNRKDVYVSPNYQ